MNTIRDRLGQHGCDIVTTTGAAVVEANNTWFAIQGMWSTTTFATLTEIGTRTLSGTIASIVLFDNQIIYGAFTNFTLATGAVRAYRARPTSG